MSFQLNLEGPRKAPEWLYKLCVDIGEGLTQVDVETVSERMRFHFDDGSSIEGPWQLFEEAKDDLMGSI
jgi:hypothetical protein